jgi:hypothetical protein
MNKAVSEAYIRQGVDSLELTADDIFDRIINLKFIRKYGSSFTLRSDYEPVFYNDGGDGSIGFKKCVQKPDIKVTYKQVAESVAIEVDIEVVNFYIADENRKSSKSINTAEGDPVQWCIIQMGYRKQFPDWTAPERKGNIDQFYDLNNNAITSEAEVRRGRQILVQILTGYPKTYSPDSVMYFKGIIGTMEDGLRWNHTEDDLVKGYGDSDFPEDFSEIEEVLFQFVTRRFIRPSVQHTAETVRNFTNKEALADIVEKQFEQKIKIYGYKDYPGSGADSASELRNLAATVTASDTEWSDLPVLENGIMSVENANKFGVICAVSQTLRSMGANALYGYGLTEEQAAVLKPIPPTSFDNMQDTLGGQLVAIQQSYPFLRWYVLTDGNFFFYHEKDADTDLRSDPFIKDMQKENARFLPAVYDMTPSGTRTIRCPFISFISSMMTVIFQSRFTLGTLVSYFYPVETNAFLVITAAIEFATVQDNNVMELMCVDLPPQEIMFDEDTGQVKVKEPEGPTETPAVAKLQQLRNMEWIKKELTVVTHKRGATDTDSSWSNLVKNEVIPNVRPERFPEPVEYTETMALELLKEFNPAYFEKGGEYMLRGNSIENDASGIGGRTGIKVSWLKKGDKVIVPYPVQPEYPDDQEVVV